MDILWIYIGVILLLTIVYLLFFIHWKKLSKSLTQQIDTLLFTINSSIYKNKSTIYDYEITKSLLFHNQTQFFEKGKNYTDITIPLIKDIEYLKGLLQQDIISESEVKIIKATYITWQKVNTLKEYTHTILIILTLGTAKLLLP